MAHGTDVTRVPRLIAERPAQQGHALGDGVLTDMVDMPDRLRHHAGVHRVGVAASEGDQQVKAQIRDIQSCTGPPHLPRARVDFQVAKAEAGGQGVGHLGTGRISAFFT